LSGIVEIDEFAVFLLPYLRKVQKYTPTFIAHYDNTPFWIPAVLPVPIRMTLNARFILKCA